MPHEVRFTANFNANLHSSRDFLAEQDAANTFQDIVPNLQLFPLIGRNLLALEPLPEECRPPRESRSGARKVTLGNPEVAAVVRQLEPAG